MPGIAGKQIVGKVYSSVLYAIQFMPYICHTVALCVLLVLNVNSASQHTVPDTFDTAHSIVFDTRRPRFHRESKTERCNTLQQRLFQLSYFLNLAYAENVED